MATRLLGLPLLALALSACDPYGLDLYDPVDARDYARSCARSQIDVYCEAMLPTLAATTGPVALIMPNEGDTERTAQLTDLLKEKGMTLQAFLRDEVAKAAFARANIFAVDRLTTGTHKTLDGRPHQVTCAPKGPGTPQTVSCQMDELEGVNRLEFRPAGSGSVYATGGPTPGALPFFRF